MERKIMRILKREVRVGGVEKAWHFLIYKYT